MGRAEKVAKLEALLERVQQRASQPRAYESGDARPSRTARVRAPVVELAPPPRVSASTLPTRPAPAIVPRERDLGPTPSSRRTPLAAPVSPRAFPTSPEVVEPLAAAAPEPSPSPVTTVAASANLPIFERAVSPRESFPTPAATVITPHASEKPALRVNPEMTAPVSAEEVAAAAARMNKVPTFPDAFPIDARQAASLAANAASAAVAKSASSPSADESVEVEAVGFPSLSAPKFELGQEPKDVYMEDGEEPTKPLAHPPRTAAPKPAQELIVEPPAPVLAAPAPAPVQLSPQVSPEVPKTRPATIPFDAYPPPRGDASPLSDPASPRAMVVPREVENQPAFLSNLRQGKEGGGGGAFKWVVLLLVLVAAAYGAYALGFLKPLLSGTTGGGEAPK